jgi:hypothetical protein
VIEITIEVESSFVDIADTPTTAVAAPADNTTGLNTQQQTALAVGTIIILTLNSIQNLNYFKFHT